MGLISKLLGKEKQKDTNGMWEGLLVGDLVGYKDRQFLYRGINPNGGPRMAGIAEPTFGMPRPSVTYEFYITYYLRNQDTVRLSSSPRLYAISNQIKKFGSA